jgi:hypothetical protein
MFFVVGSEEVKIGGSGVSAGVIVRVACIHSWNL